MKYWTTKVKWFCFGLGLVMIGAFAGSSIQGDGGLAVDLATEAEAENKVEPINIFAKITREQTPAVVNISTAQKVKTKMPGMGDERMKEFYEKFFPFFREMPKEQTRQSLGSGFVVEEDGYILTNAHVVQSADEIMVTFGGGNGNGHHEKEYKAKLIGADPKTDIALIKIEPDKKLQVMKLGDSDLLQVGEWVIAIGNPFGFAQSVTVGVVSAKGRAIGAGPYDDFIQTDASINPGNSGGPLLNVKGEVIGINSAIFTGGMSQGNIGIGFAIPVNTVKAIYTDLKDGRVKRGWLGVSIQPITPELEKALGLSTDVGALVGDVFEKSPAEKAGIKRGDVIVEFNGKEVPSSEQLPRMVAFLRPGTKVDVKIIRDGKSEEITLSLGEMPDDVVKPAESSPTESLGMVVEKITPELARKFGLESDSGVVVTRVLPGSAMEAGIRAGDVITEVNRKKIDGIDSYRDALSDVKSGESALMLVQRGRNTVFVAVKMPES
ncbi:HtrA protease/chaperone protein [hydrothermal vent metagenome]|uniref:Probable periplasmic serine endoprotease DegP-like n=1 Tax=hydrothermal vent metagenome TaxID=652676 RepID=A0A3B1CR64_9ZZZZ